MKVAKNLQSGFTLMEIMLVVALLSIITVYWMSNARQQLEEAAIQRTAMDISQWLQAAQAYRRVHGSFLTNNQSFTGCNSDGIGYGSTTPWMPQGVQGQTICSIYSCSPWLAQKGDSSACATKLGKGEYTVNGNQNNPDGTTRAFFKMHVFVPTMAIADGVANLLPMAVAYPPSDTSKSPRVDVYIMEEPGAIQYIKHGYVFQAGTAADGDKLALPPCRSGFVGHMLGSYADVITAPYRMTGIGPAQGTLSQFSATGSPSASSVKNAKYSLRISANTSTVGADVSDNATLDSEHNGYYFLKACLPDWTLYISSGDAQRVSKNEDTQSDSNWEEYQQWINTNQFGGYFGHLIGTGW